MSRVSCQNDENPENQANQFWAFLPKMQIYYIKRTPQPQIVGFRDLVGTGIAPV
jgi:hypothetical protein